MRFARINLVKYRRAIGLTHFSMSCCILLVYLVLDKQFDWGAIGKDIIKRPYITIGMAAFALLVPLAVTSNNASIRRLGAAGMAQAAQPGLSGGAARRGALSDAGEGVAAGADRLSPDRRCTAGGAAGETGAQGAGGVV
jgi:hypothetical protein